MDLLLDHAPCGYLQLSNDGTILHANATLLEWLGYAPGELTGRLLASLLDVGDRIFCQTHLFPMLKLHGRVEEIYLTLKGAHGETPDVLLSASRTPGHEAQTSEWIFLPLRQRHRYEEELLQAKKAAEEASGARARFLSMMSHELRTPMNAILGFADLLGSESPPPKHLGYVDHIRQAGQHLLQMINEVLDLARLEAGRLEVSPEPVPASAVLEEILEMARPLAAGAGIQLRLEAGLPGEERVLADRGRLRQVLLNLLSNGIKYNRPGGTVTLGCEPAPPAGSGEPQLRLTVTDTGKGIPAETLGKLFVPFERLGAEGSGIEGTGLGLSLSQGLAEAMGGRLGVASVVGLGSRFWIELPAAKAPAAPEQTAAPRAPASGREQREALILCVEDNPANCALLKGVFQRFEGVQLLFAGTGADALELAAERRPDLVLLDLQLPDISGYDVLIRLHSAAATRATPVLVLSADATDGQRKRLLDAGAQDYLAKPLDLAIFCSVVEALLQQVRKGWAER